MLSGVVLMVTAVPSAAMSVPPSLPAGYVIAMPAWAGRFVNPLAVGGSLTAVTVTVVVTWLLRLLRPAPSLTCQVTVRAEVFGFSELLLYVTARRADWKFAGVVGPLRVSVHVPLT